MASAVWLPRAASSGADQLRGVPQKPHPSNSHPAHNRGLALATGPNFRSPGFDYGFDLRTIFIGIESFGLTSEADEDRPHVSGNRLINPEQVRQIESAKGAGIPPCENERRHAPRLTGIASCDLQ